MDTKVFDAFYKTLTKAQKQAVDAVEGPVLVVAGPGTGKTHILTLRIANILIQTQATPGNILVLTFTESAARTIRNRLKPIIGEAAAREVFVATFHGFAEYVLSAHGDSFPQLLGRRLMGDVENTLLWRDVFDTEDMVHLRPAKSPYHYLRDLSALQRDLVRERVSLLAYCAWAKEEEVRIQEDETLRYQRDGKTWTKGELKPEGRKRLERLERVYEAARLIEAYEARKEARGVYDFADVLRTVVDGLSSDPALAATLQETFQYVLADEHQDANRLQHALLDALAYDEHPNLFVVGDEKQAIFRFQGADATHFRDFTERYPRALVVTLTENFRSFQEILDRAHALAESRMPTAASHAQLSATREGSAAMRLIEAPDPLAERDQIATIVADLIEKGVAPHEIAVIASRNSTANLLAQHLQAKGLPVLRAGDITLEARPLIRALLSLMAAVAEPLNGAALRESVLAPWWDLPLEARARLLMQTRDKDLPTALAETFPGVGSIIRELQEDALRLPPLELFSRLIERSGARGYALSRPEHIGEDVALIRRLMLYVEEAVARDPNVSFPDIVRELTRALELGLSGIKASVLTREGEVTVITAHKAKGMEFTHVFIAGLIASEWEKGGKPALIPSPIDMARSVDDAVRQFYVALTRARETVTLSYARESGEGRERDPSVLIPEGLTLLEAQSEPLPILHTTIRASKLVCSLTRSFLTDEGLSPSALQEYLDSPPCFFAKRVLRLKEPEIGAITIGNSVHAGIAAYLEKREDGAGYAALERSLRGSLLPRNSSFDQLAEDARARLAQYLSYTGDLSETVAIEESFVSTKEFSGTNVLLRGKVDAVFRTTGGECIVDFKTSREVKPDDEAFAHQLAFYDLLLRDNGHNPVSARIIQVSRDHIQEHPIPLTNETRAAFSALLEEVVNELLSGGWRTGAPSAYDDLLALFA